ncbi:MAG TPA: hypothetical protein VG845_14620 [Dehalococcoidia bacterium]|nr:hypothetical protein [Dehalococcoidia bacterium]
MRFLGSIPFIGLLVSLAWLQPGSSVTRVYACSVVIGPLDIYAADADVVAVVRVVSAGNAEVTAPTVMPAPTATAGPVPPLHPQTRRDDVDLRGIGARVRLVEAVGGAVPGAEFDVDASRRREVESLIRREEADPNFQYPCDFDFAVPRYAPGETWLLFLSTHETGGLVTEARMRVQGDNVVIRPTAGEILLALEMSSPVYYKHFAGIAATELTDQFEHGDARFGDGSVWTLVSGSAPVDWVVAAVRDIRSGEVYRTQSPRPPGLIRPPDTGNAGLR